MTSPMDSLHFQPVPLRSESSVGQPDTSQAIPSAGGHKVEFGLPGFMSEVSKSRLGEIWAILCGVAHDVGVGLYSTAADFDKLPAASLPIRATARPNNEPIDAGELENADLFELQLRSTSGPWSLPGEVEDLRCFASLVESLRIATSGRIPIGIQLPLALAAADLALLLEAEPDYLHVVADGEVSDFQLSRLAAVRREIGHRKVETKVLATLPVRTVDDILKTLALGADLVSLDAFLRDYFDRVLSKRVSSDALTGRLSSLGVMTEDPAETRLASELAGKLSAVKRRLGLVLAECGADSLGDFGPQSLVSTCPRLAELLAVREVTA